MTAPSLFDLARELLAKARAARLHIATAESCTGGLIAAALTEIPGSSDVFERGFVVYTNPAKSAMLAVPEALIARVGAVSEEVARAMASGALAQSTAELAVSCTGIAGPGGGSKAKPVGLVHIAAARKDGLTMHRECRFGDIGRSQMRARTVEEALILLLALI